MTLLATTFCLAAETGCIVPPPLEKEVDGGVNRPPEILATRVTPEVGVRTYDPELFTPKDSQLFTIGFKEPDRQTVYFRMFKDGDYTQKIPIDKDSTGVDPDGEGAIQFRVNNICGVHLGKDTVCSHIFEVYISDVPFVDETLGGEDLRKTTIGGLKDSVAWYWKCTKSGSQ